MKRSADLAIVCVTVLIAIFMMRSGPMPVQDATPVTAASANGLALEEAILSSLLFAQAGDPVGQPPASPGNGSDRAAGATQSNPAPRPPALTADLIETAMEVARDIDERLAAKLIELRKQKPAEFAARLRSSRRLLDLAQLKQQDERLYQLKMFELRTDANVSRIALEYCLARRAGRKGDLTAIKKELYKEVVFQVGSSLRTRTDYICKLEDLVRQEERKLQDQRSAFNDLVSHRMNHLLSCANARAAAIPAGGRAPKDQAGDAVPAE